MTTYRWNASAAAEAFDACAPAIHPFYVAVQDEILRLLADEEAEPKLVVDLGGGSGRLIERVLEEFPNSRGVVIDQSPAFLAIAERRLARFGARATFVEKRLQEDWAATLAERPNALVSMSAIHHLEPAEKRVLYQRCYDALALDGLFLNGDEVRPENDAEYLGAMTWWSHQKEVATAAGLIPESFRPMSEAWHERNITRFGEPKQSGDDCHETAAVQLEYLREAGFRDVQLTWNEQLWGVLFARR
ncbi:MAG: trans-aconitate 2-methyltransferase [Pirellulales bacterium]